MVTPDILDIYRPDLSHLFVAGPAPAEGGAERARGRLATLRQG
jgi:hypothetical protein